MTCRSVKIKRFSRNDSCVLRAGRVCAARGLCWGAPFGLAQSGPARQDGGVRQGGEP